MRWKVGRAGKLIGIVMVSITHGAEVQMWLEDAMIRVMRQTPPHETTDLRLHAARGEWEPFQVVLTGPAEAWRGARVRASELRGSDGTTLPAPQVWREHYVTVEKASLHAPLPPGDYPDALVPQDFPEAPPPSADTLNQPFWVDVKVPYAVPAQRYRGAVEAQLTDGTVLRREYELEVWDFDLPVTPSLRSSFWLSPHRVAELHGFGRAQENPPPELAQLLEAYATLLAEHRLSIFQMWATARTRGDQLDTEAVEPVLRRQLLHRHAACLAVPLAEDWPFSDPLGRDRPALKRYLADWVHLLEKIHAPGRTYLALGSLDEPNDAAGYERVRRWGALVDEAEQQHGIRLPLMVTEQPVPDDPTWGDLIGAADIWVPHFSAVYEDLESPDGKREIARRLAAGEEVWTYAALAQFSDSWM
ncbi:MAG: hypothetical protein KDK99_14670, partial [Verrucomicrobiales bacterium]|nr:hypothetical protein [Verrucomicrobiales bacterium]